MELIDDRLIFFFCFIKELSYFIVLKNKKTDLTPSDNAK
jgi:hypothetical protein